MGRTFASKLAKRKAAASCAHSKASLRLPEQASRGFSWEGRHGQRFSDLVLFEQKMRSSPLTKSFDPSGEGRCSAGSGNSLDFKFQGDILQSLHSIGVWRRQTSLISLVSDDRAVRKLDSLKNGSLPVSGRFREIDLSGRNRFV